MIRLAVLLLAISGIARGQDIESLLPVVISSGSRAAGISSSGRLLVEPSAVSGTQDVNIVSTFSATNAGYVRTVSTFPVSGTFFQSVQPVSQSGSFTVTPGTGVWDVSGATQTSIIAYQGGSYTVTPGTGSWVVSNIAGSSLPVTAYPVDGFRSTYSSATLNLVPAATPTDVCTLTGSATKTIRITKITFSASQTSSGLQNVILIKRSSANSGGTSASSGGVPHDSADPAASAVFRSYTANPTLGTSIGNIVSRKYFIEATAPLATAPDMDFTALYHANSPSKAIVLRGTSQVASVNLNSVTLTGGSVNCSIEWTEE